MNIEQWREFLQRWSDEWLSQEKSLSSRMRKARWLGSRPVTEKQIAQLEKRIGYQLPPSYRNFLLTTNGWSHTTEFIERIRPAAKVDWLQNDDPALVDAWPDDDDQQPMDGLSSEEYFAYDQRAMFEVAHMRETLIIADPVAGDSMIYLLNPLVVAEDGEWEAWRFAHWIPGAERFSSFELLMRAERASFLGIAEDTPEVAGESSVGPYQGVYAPDRPRHQAVATKPKPPRMQLPTVPELMARLESPDRKGRLAAAKILLNGSFWHDEHPELIAPLGRALRSQSEPEVRCAAPRCLVAMGMSAQYRC